MDQISSILLISSALLILAAKVTNGAEVVEPNSTIFGEPQPNDGHLRISDGETVPTAMYPFMVAILKNNRLICGGSIIASGRTYHGEPAGDAWILTAAHCFDHAERKDLLVVANTNSLTQERGNAFKVKTLIRHSTYDERYFGYDIALLKLHPQDECKSCRLTAVTLARTGVGPNTVLTAIGFGELQNGHLPRYLQEITVYLLNFPACREYFPGVNSNEICTTAPAGKEICDGDSGGPLIMSNGNGHPVIQYGIISSSGKRGSKHCGTSPAIHTDVTKFREWIHGHTGIPI